MRNLIYVLLIGLCLDSCSVKTSPGTPQAVIEQMQRDSIQKVIAEGVSKQESPLDNAWKQSYYSASDFGLPAGVVLEFTPSIETWPEDESNYEQWVKISEPSGHIAVVRIDKKGWYTLNKGDVLK